MLREGQILEREGKRRKLRCTRFLHFLYKNEYIIFKPVGINIIGLR
jgi:hypothetical protein